MGAKHNEKLYKEHKRKASHPADLEMAGSWADNAADKHNSSSVQGGAQKSKG